MSSRTRTPLDARMSRDSSFELALDAGYQRDLFVFREKRALARVQHHAREVVRQHPQRGVREIIFVGQSDAVGQRAVGVERDDDALLEIAPKWMFRHRSHYVRVDVACEAHLEWDLAGDDFF